MISYSRVGNTFKFNDDNETFSFTIPKHPKQTDEPHISPLRAMDFLDSGPSSSKSGRYIALAKFDKIYVFDRQTNSLTESKFKMKSYIFESPRFDEQDRIYFICGNSIFRWVIGEKEAKTLYNLYRATHGPSDIGTSPSGRYVSFLKYRNDSQYLYVYDTVTEGCRDYKTSVYHYAWLDETHIVYTKSEGIIVLDIETGKSKHIIKDLAALAKRSSQEDADLIRELIVDPKFLSKTFSILGVRDGRIWFSLWACDFKKSVKISVPILNMITKNHLEHLGIWSVNSDGSDAQYAFEAPDKIRGRFVALTDDKRIAFSSKHTLTIYDRESKIKLEEDWSIVRCYEASSR